MHKINQNDCRKFIVTNKKNILAYCEGLESLKILKTEIDAIENKVVQELKKSLKLNYMPSDEMIGMELYEVRKESEIVCISTLYDVLLNGSNDHLISDHSEEDNEKNPVIMAFYNAYTEAGHVVNIGVSPYLKEENRISWIRRDFMRDFKLNIVGFNPDTVYVSIEDNEKLFNTVIALFNIRFNTKLSA